MKIDPETRKKIIEAVADGTAREGPPPVIPMPSADLVKLPPVREKDFQARVVRFAEQSGWLVYHTHDSRRSNPGFPDLVMLRDDTAVVAELKVPPNKTTSRQRAWLAAFEAAHITAYLWTPDDWPAIEEVLR